MVEVMLLTYENHVMMSLIRDVLRPFLEDGETLIYRQPFRWFDDTGNVLSNHYESMDLPSLAEEFDYEIVHDFHHVGVIRSRRSNNVNDRS